MTAQHKTLHLAIKAAGAPDEAQLAAIRQYTLRDFTADELMVRTFVLAHNCIDRDDEVFDEALLADFRRSIVGKGVYIRHPQSWDGDSGPAEGRVFGARVETIPLDEARKLLRAPNLHLPPDRSQVEILYVDAFFARTDENKALLTKLDAGIAGDVSVGFSAASREPVYDSAGNELTARRWKAPGEALEMSLVWLGAQPGARAVKAARPSDSTEDSAMNEEQIKQLKDANAELQEKATAGAKAASKLKALADALGDALAALLDTPQKLAALVTEGKALKTALVDDIVASERQLGLTEDTEDAVKAAKELYEGLPVAKLHAIKQRHDTQLPTGGSRVTGSDPNGRKAGDKGANKDAAIDNPAFQV